MRKSSPPFRKKARIPGSGALAAPKRPTSDDPASRQASALMTAQEAVQHLGIKPATLYAYVSRGLLRSVTMRGTRERRYPADEVQHLKRLRYAGRRTNAPPAAFDVLTPVLDSAICLVERGRLYYRGIDASEFADRADLEQTARLLWQIDSPQPFEGSALLGQLRGWLKHFSLTLSPMDRARSVLLELAMRDLGTFDSSPESLARTGGRLVRALATAICGAAPTNAAIHTQLAEAWDVDRRGADLIRRCLILAADHELNPSTYVARCVASTAASPYAAVLAALSALSGPRHGGQTTYVEGLLRELEDSQDIMLVMMQRQQRGEIPGYGAERIPGFGHPLYPNGDPRAANILIALQESRLLRAGSPILNTAQKISDQIGRAPNFDFALAAVSHALKLPRGSGLGIWLVGRTVGWIAHVMEQYASGALIRPRARYIGAPAPEKSL